MFWKKNLLPRTGMFLKVNSRRSKGNSPFALKLACVKVMLPRGGGGVMPYKGYIGMCRCLGYGFKQFTLG